MALVLVCGGTGPVARGTASGCRSRRCRWLPIGSGEVVCRPLRVEFREVHPVGGAGRSGSAEGELGLRPSVRLAGAAVLAVPQNPILGSMQSAEGPVVGRSGSRRCSTGVGIGWSVGDGGGGQSRPPRPAAAPPDPVRSGDAGLPHRVSGAGLSRRIAGARGPGLASWPRWLRRSGAAAPPSRDVSDAMRRLRCAGVRHSVRVGAGINPSWPRCGPGVDRRSGECGNAGLPGWRVHPHSSGRGSRLPWRGQCPFPG